MNGKLIVIEGLDGSGKATQAKLLTQRLKSHGQDVIPISFPDYSHPSSTLVKMYLKGEIGSLDEVNAFAASSFYSLDRYISFKTIWEKDYKSGKLIIADRYTTSNLSHQMSKLSPEKWEDYIKWLTNYEYELLELPRPNLVIYLDMHPDASRKLLLSRYNGDESKKDIHENNYAYLLKCRQAGLFAANKLSWRIVKCHDDTFAPLSPIDISVKVAGECEKIYTEDL